MRKIKIIFIVIIFYLFPHQNVYSIENKILLKIDNELITSIDVFIQTKYLMAINEKLNEMEQNEIYKISINSLLREKIKKIEILKNINDKEINIDEKFLNEMIITTYKRLGYNTIKDFNNHLKKYEINIEIIKEKISIESLWNELIYKKFSNKLLIDKDKLRKKIINDNNKKIKSYSISEIIFQTSQSQSVDEKFKLIVKDIDEKSFSNAVLLHSISDTANSGGNLGWINENSLNQKIKNEISNLKIGGYTKPITIPGGFLILKLNNIKLIQNEFNINKKLEELVRITTNQQLNQLSNIYFDKAKKEVTINEL